MKKVILITGASAGMGKETALRFIKEGHIVYGAARRIENMKDLVEAGGFALKMDVTDEQNIREGVQQVLKEQGRIDVLWNNAGYAVYGAVEDVTLEDARRQFEVNMFGLAAVTKEVLPSMRERKSGLIVNTSSMGGKVYSPLGAWYHATKHALEGWSDCLRIEVKQFGIDVVVLEPGAIATEFGDVMMKPMVDRSKGGAYEEFSNKYVKMMAEMEGKPNSMSPSSEIAETMVKIVNARNPKTRYVKGKLARPSMFMRKYLGDRVFDRMVMSMIK